MSSVDEDSDSVVGGCIFCGCCCLRLLSCDGPSSDVDSCGRLVFDDVLLFSLLGACVGCFSVVGAVVSVVGVVSVGGAGVSVGAVVEVLVEHWLA